MEKYHIISNINIKHTIEANSRNEALEIYQDRVELPECYCPESWELEKIILERNGKIKTI